MIRNMLLTAFRSLQKNKFFSLLNITGLGIGMAVFLLIALYVKFERSYEDFIPDKDDIYRVKLDTWLNNELIMSSAENYPGVGPVLRHELPGVTDYARLYNVGYKNNVVITYKEAKPEPIALKQQHFLYADSSFLSMMGYPMVKGDARTALARPLTAVISETYAALYFKREDPIGKTLVLQDDDLNMEPAQVTGVFKDLPENTHLQFDVLFSYKTLFGRGNESPGRYDNGWSRNDMYTFIRLQPGTDRQAIEARLPAIVEKYKPGSKNNGQQYVLGLQPLKDIHLRSALAEEATANGNERIVVFMSVIGLFILVIAWINYINLATARSVERAKEVGVRKVMGAFKAQLIKQFLVEAALVNLIAIAVAVLQILMALPISIVYRDSHLLTHHFTNPGFYQLLLCYGLAALYYPAFILRWYSLPLSRSRY
ncbi:ABC transporter permease [Paraflavitalea speifideaquila]|uniref:ABC transporter permease n=1 Tax=Paraflavitalea speifideaquila TaxID=3076558 RepID=UPI0028E59946|nr:ABC transporter permease [Paraflavitalea speifideiaquila]